MGMPYHKPYYRPFFEKYGFRNYFEQYSYHIDLTQVDIFPPRLMKIAEWIAKKPGYSFRHFQFGEVDRFVQDMASIYDETWSVFKEDFTPMDHKVLYESLEKSKPIIDEELIWFAYHKGKPVAFFILFPDLNQIIKHFNGKMHLWNKIRFLILKKRKAMTRLRALVAGVHPSYQNAGIESAIFHKLYFVFKKKPWYQELELSWVGDFNPKMISIYEAINGKHAKTHITYRYLFRQNAGFIRYKDELQERQEERLEKLREVSDDDKKES
jgi:GNAT superfamily N-acetyltransferase